MKIRNNYGNTSIYRKYNKNLTSFITCEGDSTNRQTVAGEFLPRIDAGRRKLALEFGYPPGGLFLNMTS